MAACAAGFLLCETVTLPSCHPWLVDLLGEFLISGAMALKIVLIDRGVIFLVCPGKCLDEEFEKGL